MSYGLIYTIPFKSRLENSFQVNIEKDGYIGDSTELKGAATPFTVEVDEPDNDFIYEPKRVSTAKIKLLGNDYLQNLYSNNYQQYKVTLYKGTSVKWCGFIKPENYTQEYCNSLFELDIDCLSALNVLQYINYTQQGTDERIFVSFIDLFKLIISSAKGNYEAVYIPHVYGDTADNYATYDNVLAKMKVSEQNFFDEDDEPMKLDEVLDAICRFLNWSYVDWCGSIYFIDSDWTGEYLKYTTDFSSYEVIAFPTALSVQSIGFAGSDHTLDILPGYNKVTVKTNNYNAGDVFPTESYDDLKELETRDYDSDDLYNFYKDYVYKADFSKERSRKIFLEPQNFKPHLYRLSEGVFNEVDPLNVSNHEGDEQGISDLFGAQLIKRCNYTVDDGGVASIINYSYEDLIQIRKYSGATLPSVTYDPTDNTPSYDYDKNPESIENMLAFGVDKPILEFAGRLPTIAYADGAISIDMQVELTFDGISNCMISYGKITPVNFSGISIKCLLKVGDKYWNGDTSAWSDTISYFKLVADSDTIKSGEFDSINSNKTLSVPYNGLTGYIIPLPDGTPLCGELIFKIVDLESSKTDGQSGLAEYHYNCFIKDFSMNYQLKDGYNTDSNTDRTYENVIDGNFANELDEIEEKISSYNYDGLCYSKVILNDAYLTDNLYSSIEKTTVRLEEQLIKRIINYYSATKIKLTQVLKEDDSITPISTFVDSYMNSKKFMMNFGSIDYQDDSFTVTMIEK